MQTMEEHFGGDLLFGVVEEPDERVWTPTCLPEMADSSQGSYADDSDYQQTEAASALMQPDEPISEDNRDAELQQQGTSDRAWQRVAASDSAEPLSMAEIFVGIKTRDDKDRRYEVDETLYSSLVYQFEYSLFLPVCESPLRPPQVCACLQLVDAETETELRSSDGKPLLTGDTRVVCDESTAAAATLAGCTGSRLLVGQSKIKIKATSSRFPESATWMFKLSLFDLRHNHGTPTVVLLSAPFKVRARRRQSRGTKRNAASAELDTTLRLPLPLAKAPRSGPEDVPGLVFTPIKDPSTAFSDCARTICALLSRLSAADRRQAVELLHLRLI